MTVLRPSIQRLVRVLIAPKAFGHPDASGEETEAAKAAFYEDVLVRVNSMLDKRSYLVLGNEATAVDIIYFNEISTVIFLLNMPGFKKKYPNLEKWISFMNEIPQLIEYTNELDEIITKYELE